MAKRTGNGKVCFIEYYCDLRGYEEVELVELNEELNPIFKTSPIGLSRIFRAIGWKKRPSKSASWERAVYYCDGAQNLYSASAVKYANRMLNRFGLPKLYRR